jgi:hypothetical protein
MGYLQERRERRMDEDSFWWLGRPDELSAPLQQVPEQLTEGSGGYLGDP